MSSILFNGYYFSQQQENDGYVYYSLIRFIQGNKLIFATRRLQIGLERWFFNEALDDFLCQLNGEQGMISCYISHGTYSKKSNQLLEINYYEKKSFWGQKVIGTDFVQLNQTGKSIYVMGGNSYNLEKRFVLEKATRFDFIYNSWQ